jgi:hypothetical protein
VNRAHAAIAVGLVVPTLVLGGCSGEPEPKFAPSQSPPVASASSSPTPRASSPRVQQAQFIDNYFGVISTSISTGKPEPFLALSSDDCRNCKVFADNLTAAYANGGRIEGGSCRVVGTRHVRQARLGAIWNVDVKFSRERWMDADGNLTKIVRGGIQHFGIAVAATKKKWVVRELRLR